MACAFNTMDSNGTERLRMILLGKTGVGKSSLGNVLLERDTPHEEENPHRNGFAVCGGMASGTQFCCSKIHHNTLLNRSLEVIDTPGLYDTSSADVMTTLKDLTKMLCLSLPGPHAILFLVRCDVKFTEEEGEAFYKIKTMFDDTVLKYIIIVFTHGEHPKVPIERVIKTAPESLKKILKLVGNKYTVMSKTENMELRTTELRNLISKVDEVSAFGTKYYTDGLLEKLNRTFKEAIDQKMKDRGLSIDEAKEEYKKEIQDGSGGIWKNVLLIVFGSTAFAILIGLSGGLSAFAFLSLTGDAAIGLGTMAGLSSFVTSLSIKLRDIKEKNRNMCNIS